MSKSKQQALNSLLIKVVQVRDIENTKLYLRSANVNTREGQ